MVARFHMFAMVYFHQKSIAYEEMLKRHMWSDECRYRLPSDMAGYCDTDDAHLWAYLRESTEPWARRVVEYRPFKVVKELHGQPGKIDLSDCAAQLEAENIPHFMASASGAMGDGADKLGNPIYVLDRKAQVYGGAVPLAQATDIFQRYHDRRSVSRLYVERADLERARAVLGSVG